MTSKVRESLSVTPRLFNALLRSAPTEMQAGVMHYRAEQGTVIDFADEFAPQFCCTCGVNHD